MFTGSIPFNTSFWRLTTGESSCVYALFTAFQKETGQPLLEAKCQTRSVLGQLRWGFFGLYVDILLPDILLPDLDIIIKNQHNETVRSVLRWIAVVLWEECYIMYQFQTRNSGKFLANEGTPPAFDWFLANVIPQEIGYSPKWQEQQTGVYIRKGDLTKMTQIFCLWKIELESSPFFKYCQAY